MAPWTFDGRGDRMARAGAVLYAVVPPDVADDAIAAVKRTASYGWG